MVRSTVILVSIIFSNLIVSAFSQTYECTREYKLTGSIKDEINAMRSEKCWIIEVPKNYYIFLELTRLQFESANHNGLEITELKTSDKHIFDGTASTERLVFSSNVKILHYARNSGNQWWSKFTLVYEIDTFPVKVLRDSVGNATFWLTQERTLSWGWQENTHRAIVALYLASPENFNETNLEGDLMVKQMELKVLEALLRSSLTNSELSMIVHALLVTCHNPRSFFGKNLVKRLKFQVEATQNFTHPLAYLALCNAKEDWPSKALDDLHRVLTNDIDYPFVRDIQAIAILALSCMGNVSISLTDGSNTSILYNNTIERFLSFQNEDGSFGNTHTTAWITQALLSRNQENINDWKLFPTMNYLMKELNSPSVDFLTVYTTLPILKRKTLADISKVNCSNTAGKNGNGIVTENINYLGSKIRVKYSLYIGDQKDVIHTISLRVPRNFTAYKVMDNAAAEDPKYNFEYQTVSGKVYVFQMAGITNDPENGKFWLPYISPTNKTAQLMQFSTDLGELIVHDGQHLVMWYKTANI